MTSNHLSRGAALLVSAAALALVAACSGGSDAVMQGGKGRVQIVMSASTATATTAPAVRHDGSSTGGDLKAANVTFASILARNLDGQLVDVTIALPVTVDLIGLVSNGSFTLPAGFLPPGTYDQLVLVITQVELTLADDTVVTIDPPGGGWTAVIPVTEAFTVADGQTTTVSIKFRPDRLFSGFGDEWQFHPEFECDDHRDGDHGDDD